MNNLFVFRHGQTNWNKEGICQGHIEILAPKELREISMGNAQGMHRGNYFIWNRDAWWRARQLK
jgi:broad specificity phosphatase PhoE